MGRKQRRPQSSYLHAQLTPAGLRSTIQRAVKFLLPLKDSFDAIAIRGMSGCLVGVPVSVRLHKPLILVRKPGEHSHSKYETEGAVHIQRYIIIDDIVASGHTVRKIVEAVAETAGCPPLPEGPTAPACVGLLLYNGCGIDTTRRVLQDLDLPWIHNLTGI